MSEGHLPIRWQEADPIQEAVAAPRSRGHTVETWTGGLPYWLVDGETLTDGDLVALAMCLGLVDSTTTKLQ